MGNAKERRVKNRRDYLKGLAERQPERFVEEWRKRLTGWAYEARRTSREAAVDGRRIPPSSLQLMQHALDELQACGDAAFTMMAEHTWDLLVAECCKAVSAARLPLHDNRTH